MSEPEHIANRLTLRKGPVVLVGLVVAMVIGWQVVERFAGLEQRRAWLTAKITEKTGLPATIEQLDLVLFPTPNLRVIGLHIGDDELAIDADSISVNPSLSSLLSKRIQVDEMFAEGLRITVPEIPEVGYRRIEEVKAKLLAPTEPSAFDLAVDSAYANDVRLFLAGSVEPFLTFNAAGQNLLEPNVPVQFHVVPVLLGPDSRVDGDLAITKNADGTRGVSGNVSVDNATLAAFSENPSADLVRVSLQAQVAGETLDSIKCVIQGASTPKEGAPAIAQSLAGTITANAWLQQAAIYVNDFVWDSPDFDLRADISKHADGVLACKVAEASLKQSGIAQLAAALPADKIVIQPRADATIDGRDLLFGLDVNRVPTLAGGTVNFSGIDVLTPEGKSVESNVHGELQLDKGYLKIVSLTGDSTAFTGWIIPDLANNKIGVELAGSAAITREKLSLVTEAQSVRELKGELTVKRLAGTFTGAGVPPDLVVEGTISKGFAKISTPKLTETISPFSLAFVTTTDAIQTEVSMEGATLGPIACVGEYTFASRTWDGRATLDVERVVTPFLKTPTTRERLVPVLRSMGVSDFKVTAKLPDANATSATLYVERNGTPALTGDVQFSKQGATWVLGDISAAGDLDVATLANVAGPQANWSGPARIHFVRDAAKTRLSLDADLSECRLAFGPMIDKPAGAQLTVNVTGPANETLWGAEAFSAKILGESIEGKFVGDRVQVPGLDLDVAKLSSLVASGGSLTGHVSGAFSTGPTELTLDLAKVGVRLADDLAIDSIDGRVLYGGDAITIDNLRIVGADSDCLVAMRGTGGNWKGQISGEKVDADALAAMAATVSAFASASKASKTPPVASSGKPIHAEVDIATNAVYYKRGRFDKVRAKLIADGDLIQLRDFSAVPYSGEIAGAINLRLARGDSPAMVETKLTLNGIDSRILDDISPKEPRGFKGAISGTIEMTAPVVTNVNPLTGATGSVVISGVKGSLGKAGYATKVLAALRTTEILQLRLPSLKDEGLVYDKLDATIHMQNGFMTIDHFALSGPSLTAAASGQIDWPNDATGIVVDVYPLETLTGIVDFVPVVGAATDPLRKQMGIRFHVTGSTADPKVALAPGQNLDQLKVDVKSGKEVVDSIKDKAVEKIGNAIGGIFGGKQP